MKKKVISVILAAGMIMTAAAGCSSGAGNGSEEGKKYSGVELTYWSMWTANEPQGQVLQEAADAFREETGAEITIEWKGRDINNMISSALESEEKIDLFESEYKRISQNYVDYVADLTEMAEAAGYAENSYKVFNDMATEWAGFLSCITEQPQVGGVFYNKDIFEDAGIEQTPTTWDEFIEVCKTLKNSGYQPLALDSTYAPFLFGYHLARTIGEETTGELARNGGWSDNPGVVQAADDMIDFVKAGYLADGAPDEYPNSQNKMGLDQDVAMVVCASYVTAEVNKNTETGLNWGMFNYPEVEGGADATSAYAGTNSIAITNYCENQQAAFDFATFLTSGEYDQKMADTAAQIPADPSNTAPEMLNGTVETLQNTEKPLSWNMGLNENADLAPSIHEVIVKLYEGTYDTGAEFAEALDDLY